MAKTLDLEKKRAREHRLALLALTSDRPHSSGSCLDAEELAALVEGRLETAQVEACLGHLAGCDPCYATWRRLDEDWQQRTRDSDHKRLRHLVSRPRFLATAGSILAAAASIAVFLHITLKADRRTLLPSPAPASQEQVLVAPTTDPSRQVHAEKETPAPTLPASPAPQAREPQPTAPTAQPAEQQQKKARPKGDEPRKQEAAKPAPARSPARTPQAAVKAERKQLPAPPPPTAEMAAPAPPTGETEISAKDQAVNRAEAPALDAAPAPPPTVMPRSRLQAPIAEIAAPTLAAWHRQIRQGCQDQPDPDFFVAIARQGQQLLQQSASLPKPERRQIERILALLAEGRPTDQHCRPLLDLLGPENQE